MKIEPTGAALGARITDIDLAEPLDDEQFRRIEGALHEHEVIVFPGQDLTPEAQIAFSRRFGELERHVRQDRCLLGYPEVFIVSNIIENGRPIGSQDAGFYWHSDLCYAREPSRGSLLYAREVPTDNGQTRGDTLFASMTRAWADLPADVRARLEGRPAVNSYFAGYTRERTGEARPPLTAEQRARTPDVEHPAVRTHPHTGRPCLFVNEAYTTELVGLPGDESRALLDQLFEHLKQDRYVYRHRWQVGDLLMWDNCATQHRAIIDYKLPLRRRMERTTVCGDEPFWRH